jgi:toxin-antitoxin system PIN domain toxin
VIIPEVDLLIYAVNRDAPLHEKASAWLNSALVGDESVGFVWCSLAQFVRLTTRSSLPAPLTVEQAFEILNRWITARNGRIIHPGPRHCELLLKLITATGISSNMVSNAHLAAIAIEHSAEVCSNDSDFTRFPGPRWRNPLAD